MGRPGPARRQSARRRQPRGNLPRGRLAVPHPGRQLNDRERDLMREILRRLTRDVEMAIRIALAQRLADDTTAPHDLILLLVDDPSKSRARSSCNRRCSRDSDFLQSDRRAHGAQEAVAARPASAKPVTDALSPASRNGSAGAGAQRHRENFRYRLSDSGRKIPRARQGLQEPLVRRRTCPPNWPRNVRTGCRMRSRSTSHNYTVARRKLDDAFARSGHHRQEPNRRRPRTSAADSAHETRSTSSLRSPASSRPDF